MCEIALVNNNQFVASKEGRNCDKNESWLELHLKEVYITQTYVLAFYISMIVCLFFRDIRAKIVRRGSKMVLVK